MALTQGERFILAIARPPTATQDHAVDAGDVAWAFDLPQPTVTHTPFAPVITDHAVDAGALAWAFNLPEPSVTHTPASSGESVSVTVSTDWGYRIHQLHSLVRQPVSRVALCR